MQLLRLLLRVGQVHEHDPPQRVVVLEPRRRVQRLGKHEPLVCQHDLSEDTWVMAGPSCDCSVVNVLWILPKDPDLHVGAEYPSIMLAMDWSMRVAGDSCVFQQLESVLRRPFRRYRGVQRPLLQNNLPAMRGDRTMQYHLEGRLVVLHRSPRWRRGARHWEVWRKLGRNHWDRHCCGRGPSYRWCNRVQATWEGVEANISQ